MKKWHRLGRQTVSLIFALCLAREVASAQTITASQERGDSVLLTGSRLKAEDLILTTDAIYVGEIIKSGARDQSETVPLFDGAILRGSQVKLRQLLRCGIYDQMAVTLSVDNSLHESLPQKGGSYIFFVLKDQAKPTSAYTVPYTAIKLLAATSTNIEEVKRLIALPSNQHELSGSLVRLPEAVHADTIFVGEVIQISPTGSLKAPGQSAYHGTKVDVSQILRGQIENPAAVELHVLYDPHEVPPEKGSAYVFFVNKIPGWNMVIKILPATNDTVTKVKDLIAQVSGQDQPARAAAHP